MDRKALLLSMLKRVIHPRELVVAGAAMTRFAAFPPVKVAVLTSRSGERAATKRLLDHLDKAGAQAVRCDVPDGEPTPASVAELASVLRGIGPRWLIAVGGGRIIDSAKLAWAAFQHPDLDFAVDKGGEIPPPVTACQLAAVPTTAGSGAESSIAAVVLQNDRKIPWLSAHWVPDLVVLDPEALQGVSRQLMGETGLDALAHAIEAAVSRLEHPVGSRYAIDAVRLLLDALPDALKHPDDARTLERLQYGAYLAGLAQSTCSTGLAHALSHAVGAMFHVPHARATAAMLGPSLSANLKYGGAKAAARYGALAGAAGLDSVDHLLERLDAIAKTAAIPSNLAALTGSPLQPADRSALAARVLVEPTLRTNVVALQQATIEALINEVA